MYQQLVLYSCFLFLICVLSLLFGKQIESFCSGRGAHFVEAPDMGACLHPYLYCGVKAGGYPGQNWYL